MNVAQELTRSARERVASALAEAGERMGPVWPLDRFVAVNPFLGFSGVHFAEGCARIAATAHSQVFMPPAYYREQEVSAADLDSALNHVRMLGISEWSDLVADLSSEQLMSAQDVTDRDAAPSGQRRGLPNTQGGADACPGLTEFAPTGLNLAPLGTDHLVFTVADELDRARRSRWGSVITDEISKWCALYFDQGQSAAGHPWQDRSLFEVWKEAVPIDRNPGLRGLRRLRRVVESASKDPLSYIAASLETLGVPECARADFLERQLRTVSGWAAHARRLQWEARQQGGESVHLADLTAMRLTCDVALWSEHADIRDLWEQRMALLADVDGRLAAARRAVLVPYIWQTAFEISRQRQLGEGLRRAPIASPHPVPSTPRAHFVFCIDVRSGVIRKALEQAAPDLTTAGFAGFFGVAIETVHSAGTEPRCPVLLTPSHRLPLAESSKPSAGSVRWSDAWKTFKGTLASTFDFVETFGILGAKKLIASSLCRGDGKATPSARPRLQTVEERGWGMDLASRCGAGESILRNMGLTENFARLIVLCGHGARTENNPYASSLHCGACGGHTGDANARVAAAILNDPEVRSHLCTRGISVPETTWFLAGLHDTTTEEVTLLDMDEVPSGLRNDAQKLKSDLAGASAWARGVRAGDLYRQHEETLRDESFARSANWSETRPEWGLAGNFAFVAASRERTRNLGFDGRVFLHEYHESRDPDGDVLTLILSAPMVVASWINLQYYASVVDNRVFGSGNKVLHNVTGRHAIFEGNAGDLRVGLPLQSLHDGTKWMHEPLRLSVFVEASLDNVRRVVESVPAVRELVENEWVLLFALDEKEHGFLTRVR